MTGALNLAFAPLLPWALLAPLIGLAVIVALMAFVGGARGKWWRSLLLFGLCLALLDPSIVREQREPLKDVAVVVVDRSTSQHFGKRAERTDAALKALKARMDTFGDLETRIIESDGSPAGEETDLFAPRAEGLSDVPRDRIAGTVFVTDGEVHDIPKLPELANDGPIHVLLTGEHNEHDRRIHVVEAPSYGIVGKDVTISLQITDTNVTVKEPASVKVSQDGGAERIIPAPIGRPFTFKIPLDHAGPTTVEFVANNAGTDELTLANNRAVVVVNGVRERLRVLLVSGEPHAGERTWRNLLKSDPSVDLVHFTILRPPEKNDGTPTSELSLIAFPIPELFDLRLREFDLIIFDHYEQRLLLPQYYENLANYVKKGGALLEASGPGFQGNFSLYGTALRDVLPGAPTKVQIEQPFRPTITALGERHPVTADLPGDTPDGEPTWGRWFRQGEVTPAGPASSVVMAGAEKHPLLLLAHVGEGRVAQLASDQIWMWSRGYEGGGPQAELLRRLAHWLMKEPELEENRLTATAKGRQLIVNRRSLEESTEPVNVTITAPDGQTRQLALVDAGHGITRAATSADMLGLYKVTDDVRTAFTVVGAVDTPELRDVLTTADRMKPVVDATGGMLSWLVDQPSVDIRRVDAGAPVGGRDWMGLRRNGRYAVRGVIQTPLLPAALLLVVLSGFMMMSWYREGR